MNYSTIIFDSDSYKYNLDIPLYVNKFGESVDSQNSTKDIELNEEEEINKALYIFTNKTWEIFNIYNGDNGFQS